jgi:lipid II:glycine glycyltransferase (peptidoglycan interpeptide bridge formation enzyme)
MIRPLAAGYSYKVDAANEQSWYELLRSFDDGTFSQTWAYAVTEEGPRNIRPLLLFENGEVVAAALVRFRRLPVFGFGLAYVHRGPMWRRKGAEVNVENFRQVLRALRNEFVCVQGLTLRINPSLFDDNPFGLSSIITEEGFSCTPNQPQVRTILMDLNPSIDELRQGMKRNWKRNLRHAENSTLEVIEGARDALVDDLIIIYKEMVSRKFFAASESIYKFKQIQNMLPDDLKLKIMLCRSEGKTCAGLAWSEIGDTGIEMYAATGNAGMQSSGSHLLRWKLIEKLKMQGVSCYDLNGINPARNPGTYRFKAELAGNHGRDVFYLGKYDASPGFLSASLIRFRDMLKIWKKRLQR